MRLCLRTLFRTLNSRRLTDCLIVSLQISFFMRREL